MTDREQLISRVLAVLRHKWPFAQRAAWVRDLLARDGVTVDERQVRRALAALVARDAARKTPGTPPRYLPVALYDGEPREVGKP